MNCPACGVAYDERGLDVQAGTARCFNCGHVAPLLVDVLTDQTPPRLPPPPSTRVVLDRSRPGQLVLSVPGKGGWGMIGFSLIWLLITVGITVSFVVANPPWYLPLMLSPFWLIGLLMLGFGLFTRFGITGVYLDSEQYLVNKTLWGKGWTRRGRIDEIQSIAIEEAYRQNDVPVRAVALHVGNKTIRFGSFLRNEEKRWIASELRAFLAEMGRSVH